MTINWTALITWSVIAAAYALGIYLLIHWVW